ncbi:YihY/virulence factor BrkB family protein [Nocardioides sp. zg-579]|uniref:YihY/virulence factor BrkB family protein n=1 Tax=Nocardioides marmotae TaxID=2663857 RepID=A0A6I3J0D7_9ACTN|nr:YihY/virulence factor BrkB family protein [Nocardioides marmotae]MCR6031308.1 YihY/virulence factor BrkB family protein [Gordonia jinghuaiqii]MTB94947.1 YihY/virulence factor BrkB family protein [Nocardioides marmotae]QKE02542.1 YihY/virulence factor BrkB family protein [Nocardioides marmotae]
MPSLKDRVTGRVQDVRRRRPFVDHLVRMQEHYGSAQASQQAGAVTYFAFLSFFPILALSLFTVGLVSAIYPDANRTLRDAIDSVLPGIVGPEEGQVSLEQIRTFRGWAAVLGLAGVLYSGLGWLSAMRAALQTVFAMPQREHPNFVIGKLRDGLTLVVIGTVLLLAVAVTGFVGRFSVDILGWLGLDQELGWLVKLLTVALGLAANTVLFYALYALLAQPRLPRSALLQAALLGAIGFEALKQLSGVLLASTKEQPAFQAFGIALILLVWINYFSRVVLYSAAFAYTSPAAIAQRVLEPADPVQGPRTPTHRELHAQHAGVRAALAPFAAGGAAALGLVALLRRKRTG